MTRRRQSDSRAVDWQKLRQRMAKASEVMRSTFEPTADDIRKHLEERARALSLPLQPAGTAPDLEEVLTWSVMQQKFAVEISYVREIARLRDLTPIPRAPDYLAGICNVRGAILPAFDLRRLLNPGPRGLADLSYVVVIGQAVAEFAILADRVDEVVRLSSEIMRAEASPAFTTVKCVRCICPDGTIMLDGHELLEDRAFFVGDKQQ